jgi:beta-lactamase regulating signal transducer with metallopeptidase domain
MMVPETQVLERAVDALGWALLHSVWQGTLVLAGVAFALVLLRRHSAQSRYLVAYCGLLLMLLLPAATAFRLATAPEASVTAAAETAETATRPLVDPVLFWTGAAHLLDPMIPWMVVGWLAGVLALSVRLAGGCAIARRLRYRGVSAAGELWERRLGTLIERLGITRPVRLLASTKVTVPTVFGWLKPVVLVPVGAFAALPVEQVESILAHELAHVRRHDYLFNLLQSVVEILLFFHPGVWWLSARVRAERENCCDDVAVEVSGDVRTYLTALSTLAERPAGAAPVPALGVTGSSLVARVRRLVLPSQATPGESGSRLAASLVLLSAALVLGIGVATRVDALAESVFGSTPRSSVSTTGLTYEDELRVAESCAPTEKVVRCVDAAGEIRFECGPKSPIAMLWQSLRGRAADDEARVVVDRDVSGAPEDAPAPPPAVEAVTGEPANDSGASVPPEARRFVVRTDLPTCKRP